MKFLAVKLESADLIDRFCGYSAGVEIKDLQGPEGFFFLNLTKEATISLNKHSTA